MEAMDWRQYDPAIGRFVVIDPMAEFQRKWSPYHFAFDNPVLYNDPSGLEGEEDKKKKGEPGTPGNPIPLKEVVVHAHKKSTTSSVVNFLWASVDYVPFAGSIKQIGVGIYEGNMTDVALGTVFLAVDVFTAGEGGEALRLAEVATEDALKIAAEDEAKELVERNLDELTEIAIDDSNKIERELLDSPKNHGDAPTFKKDGTSVEIHHEGQNAKGPFKEMHKSDHRMGENFRKNHPKGQTPLTKAERKTFNKQRTEYWKKEYPLKK